MEKAWSERESDSSVDDVDDNTDCVKDEFILNYIIKLYFKFI